MITKCTKCGKEVQEDAAFCQHCGMKFTETKYTCEKCGKQIDKGAEFCPHCGADFKLPQRQCGQCGKYFEGYPKFCPYCGIKFEKLNDPASKKRRKAKFKGWFALVLVPFLISGVGGILVSNKDFIKGMIVGNMAEYNVSKENMKKGSEDPEEVVKALILTIINRDTAHLNSYLDMSMNYNLTPVKNIYMSEDYSVLDFNSVEMEIISEFASEEGWKCRNYNVTVLDKAGEYEHSFKVVVHENPDTGRWYYSAPK